MWWRGFKKDTTWLSEKIRKQTLQGWKQKRLLTSTRGETKR
jgi:hypothetical protein